MYKARSITSKASSACKMNMALVEGEREINEVQKADLARDAGSQFKKEGGQSSKAIDAPAPQTTDTSGGTEEAPTPNKKKYY